MLPCYRTTVFNHIDGGNNVNIASSRLVEKLKLSTLAHPKPYKLIKQVSLAFSLGKYEDEVICDVVSMKAIHILLGKS
ncbi:hypothetical protein CR513_43609, partial [Mucuna pruriens]